MRMIMLACIKVNSAVLAQAKHDEIANGARCAKRFDLTFWEKPDIFRVNLIKPGARTGSRLLQTKDGLMKNRKAWHTFVWQLAALAVIVLCTGSVVHAQNKKAIAIIPVKGSVLAEADNWTFIRNLDDYLKKQGRFEHFGTDNVQTYFESYSIPIESDIDELKNIASDFQVNLLLVTKIAESNNRRQLKASLFDAETGAISKTVIEPCACLASDPSTFPFQKIEEILFDAPEIILSSQKDKPALLPPPKKLELPVAPTIVDTTAQNREPEPEEKPVTMQPIYKKRGTPWKRYVLGAVLVSGGVVYFLTQNGSGDNSGETFTKLNDPPSPPSSGSN